MCNPKKGRIELDNFSKESVKNVKADEFWSQKKENYRALFYCFEYIFSIMVSSVPSESLFSEAGDQVRDKRNRLDPDKVNRKSRWSSKTTINLTIKNKTEF